MSEFEFPKSSPPRFALPDHQWMYIGWQNYEEEIRVVGEWRLVRRIRFVPTAEQAKQNLQRPAKERVNPLLKPLPRRWSKMAVDAASVSDVMRNLADLVKRGLAEKQSAKDRTNKLPKFLRKKPGATMKEIRDAAGLLHYLVSLGCNSLTDIAKKNPEILQPLARKEPSWPLMMALHPGHKVNHKQFLNSLTLGKDYQFDLDEISRDGVHNGAIKKGTREIAERLYYSLQVEWERADGKLDKQMVAAFCATSSSVWWKVAKSRLLEAYPEPHKIPELARIAAPSRKFPAHIKSDILRRIKDAFCGLAKNA